MRSSTRASRDSRYLTVASANRQHADALAGGTAR
jgi:hypothetical protein